jgi:hypothetical protein
MAKGYEIRDRHGRLVEHGDDKPLRDGERLKVPLMFRDHMTPLQRAVAEDAGPRFLRAGRNTADHARLLTADAERQEAYAEMVDSMQNEWRDAPHPTRRRAAIRTARPRRR